jgi:hypothetical protein
MNYDEGVETFGEFLRNNEMASTFASAKMRLHDYHTAHKLCPQRHMKSIAVWMKGLSKKSALESPNPTGKLKTSSFSTSSQGSKRNQESQKTMKNFRCRGNKQVEFSKPKSRRTNTYELYEKTAESIRSLVGKGDNKEPGVERGRSPEGNRMAFIPTPTAIRIPLIRHEHPKPEIHQDVRLSQHWANKMPSVSFSYKSGGVCSPQHL